MNTTSKTHASSERTPLTALERGIVAKLARAKYPPGTASKRFVRDLSTGYIHQLSEKGRIFLAFVAHRFRRQYVLDGEEQAWVDKFRAAPKGSE